MSVILIQITKIYTTDTKLANSLMWLLMGLWARYVMVTVVCPMVTSQKLSKIDP